MELVVPSLSPFNLPGLLSVQGQSQMFFGFGASAQPKNGTLELAALGRECKPPTPAHFKNTGHLLVTSSGGTVRLETQ